MVDELKTVRDGGTAHSDTVSAPVADDVPVRPTPPSGYTLGAMLGRGGMGEVLLATDAKIGRDVAIKRMRATVTSDDAKSRFLREAKIQARLDHPAVVPVYELGQDPGGQPFFTMKRLTGTTLEGVLAGATHGLKDLLRAFIDVCLAIEFAHTRGVVHRDLKPSNIVLGDFGEVYVLDWGVARVLGESDVAGPGDIASLDGHTQAGQLLGTPGYMSPEQVRGEGVTTASDVYALGALLFEILAGEPLHPRGVAALPSTLSTPTVAPRDRCPTRQIAPELDAACVAALAASPATRPTPRELATRLQRYLDGDRDEKLRQDAASHELAAGRAALAAGDRVLAIRALGRAAALDPSSNETGELMWTLVMEPPKSPPADLVAAAAAEEERATRARSRRAIRPYLSFFALAPVLALLDVASWPLLIGLYVAVTAIIGTSLVNWRVRRVPPWFFLSVHLVSVVMFSRIMSPLALTPILICAVVVATVTIPEVIVRPMLVLAWTTLAVMAPFVLEWVGVFAPTWHMVPDGLLIHGTVFTPSLDGTPWGAVLGTLAATLVVAIYVRRVGLDRRDAELALHAQAWQLRQLLPAVGDRSP